MMTSSGILLRIVALLAAVFFFAPSARAAAVEKPNILLILSDDQAWGDYGFMGHPAIKTPHLDKLAAESLTFRRAYVPASLCCPSLASIITGLFPHQHRVTSNDPPVPAGMTPREFQASPAFQAGRDIMNSYMDAMPTGEQKERVEKMRGALDGWWKG